MPGLTKDQIRHEVINLRKTVAVLEKTVEEEDWERYTSKDRLDKFLKAQTVLSGVSHCRAVLSKVTPEEYDLSLGKRMSISGEQFRTETLETLDSLESQMKETVEDLQPRPKLPNSKLSSLPRPKAKLAVHEDASSMSNGKDADSVALDGSLIPLSASELREQPDIPPAAEMDTSPEDAPKSYGTPRGDLSSLRLGNPATTLLPPSLPTTSSASSKLPDFLKTSSATHDELSNQLAHMAAQLRRNAEAFNASLEKDADVVKSTQEKLEGNYGLLSQERVRLRDHSGKSGGTTWIVLLSIVVVAVGFMMTFFVIRIT